MRHVLNHGDTFHKSTVVRETLARILGRGVLVAEGEQHLKQRRALNPAFGPSQLRNLTGVFLDKANEVSVPVPSPLRVLSVLPQLRDVLDARIGLTNALDADIVGPLSACALDIIGLCGFGCAFNALSTDSSAPSELVNAFRAALATSDDFIYLMLEWLLPPLRWLVSAPSVAARSTLLTQTTADSAERAHSHLRRCDAPHRRPAHPGAQAGRCARARPHAPRADDSSHPPDSIRRKARSSRTRARATS